jgi:hypothetical protein
VALEHVAALNWKIEELQAIVRTLSDLAEHCGGDHRPDCPILDDLAGTGGDVAAASPAPGLRFGARAFREGRRTRKVVSAPPG